jgi:hypothetical protein
MTSPSDSVVLEGGGRPTVHRQGDVVFRNTRQRSRLRAARNKHADRPKLLLAVRNPQQKA